MRVSVIGYISENLAAAYCANCAAKRWTPIALVQGADTAPSGTYATAITYQLHPVFSTDEIEDLICDDCFESIGS